MSTDTECSIDGCLKKREKRGWCGTHYARWRTTGSLADPIRLESVHDAALRYVERCHWAGDCLVLRDNGEYGEVSWGPKGNRGRTTAHRAVHLTFNGPLADDEVTRHRCDNPPCVNPAHLEAGSVADNARDMYERSRRAGVRAGVAGEANPSAVLTEQLVVRMRREVRAGLSIRQVARNHGIEYTAVYSAVLGKTWRHVDEPTAKRVRKGHPNPNRTPDETAEQAAAMADAGMSLAEIGAALGMHRSTVFSVLRRAGYQRSGAAAWPVAVWVRAS